MEKIFIHSSAVVDLPCFIGDGSKIWHFCHIMRDVHIGADCILGHCVFVGQGVRLGNGCHVQNHVSIFAGVTLEGKVFVGPGVTFTNVRTPRVGVDRNNQQGRLLTLVKTGASIGANATVVCGVQIGQWALVAAGAVVTKNVAAHALVAGVPAQQTGWVCECGSVLSKDVQTWCCDECKKKYFLKEGLLVGLS